MTGSKNSTIYVTGGTGFIGRCLVEQWTSLSHSNKVIIQTRFPQRYACSDQVSYVSGLSSSGTGDFAALVNLAGAPIADSRWSPSRKRELEASRVGVTRSLWQALRDSPPPVVVSASAIGLYGLGDELVDESACVGAGYAADLCNRWETEAKSFEGLTRLVIFRLGVVLGNGGALAKLLPLFRLGMGGPIGSGRQWFSWVHMADVVSAIISSIQNSSYDGTYNLTAPKAVRQVTFARTLARILSRPAIMPTPAWVLSLVFGEMAQELLIGGQRVAPKRLEEQEFVFAYPELERALVNIVGR